MGKLTKVAQTTDIEPGQGKVIEAEGKTLAVFNVDGSFYAVDNTCLHRGGPLGEGELDGKVVTCPWHGWQYDVTTGRHAMNPSVAVRRYEVKVEGDEVKIAP